MDDMSLHDTDLTEIPAWLKEWLLLSTIKKTTTKISVKENKQVYQINKEYVYIYDKTKIVDLLNKLPDKYLDNYNSWIIVTSCLKSEGLFDVWNEWSKNGKNYDKDNNVRQWDIFIPKLNINYLVVLAKNENIDIDSNIIKTTKRINFLNVKPNVQIDKKYMDNEDVILDTNMENMCKKIMIARSGCGTGKTTFACSYINDLITKFGYQMLSISVRISLGYQQVSNFEKNKLIVANYKKISDNIELNKQNNLVIQIDSLIRLNPNSWRNTIIYLDEVSCLFSYILTSTTLDTKRMSVFNTLYDLLSKASKILVTDADVNDMVLMYFDKIKLKYHLVENVYKNPVNTPAHEYNSKEIVIKKLEQQFLLDSPTIVCFDSKKEMDIGVERLKKYCEDNKLTRQLNNFMVYSSAEGDDNDFLHINDRWKNKYVFITPKVTIGVSFDNKIPRNVYLIALGNSINSIAFVQQISRCRNIKELHYYVANKYQPIKYKCIEDVRNHFEGIIQGYDALCHVNIKNKEVDDNELYVEKSEYDKLRILVDSRSATKDLGGEWILHESIFNEMFFYNEYYDNILRSAPREQFRWLIQGKGFDIIYNNDDVDEEDKKVIGENNKIVKIRVENKDERLCQRALYNKVSSLTDNEKKIYNDALRRAKFLKIDFSKKVQKKKWEKYLISDVEFTRHIAYKLLVGDGNKLDSKISALLEKDYKITICTSLETKIKLIKKVEQILGVDTLDIDTQRDMGRFDEQVVVDDALLKLIKKTFRIIKANNKISGSFEHLYYELIQLYKHVLGNDICSYKRVTINNVNHKKFIMNNNVLNEHINLSKLL
jgi:hypothetical protein